MPTSFEKYLIDLTGASFCQEVKVIQSLWSGYGRIARYRLEEADRETVVVKHIAPAEQTGHPRGWNTNRSHDRKVRSYKVEEYWYREWNDRCTSDCRTAEHIGSFSAGAERWIVLEDLDTDYPVRKQQLTLAEVKMCLSWIASFHATFVGCTPDGLWPIGTYWHLDTRPDEWQSITDERLKSKARLIDERLKDCHYQTLVHGDAKLANFCFSERADAVAVVDFQYVGRGCGMKDLVYFLGSCLSESECATHKDVLLDHYFEQLTTHPRVVSLQLDTKALEAEWRSMYAMAWTDFTRFMLGWMPTHQKINRYSLQLIEEAISEL